MNTKPKSTFETANDAVYQTFEIQRRFALFSFQADDGIRGGTVTGVQTCALPISSFFESTTCRYPVPSRSITNPIFPDERVVITQPRVITVWPASGGRSSIRWKEGMGAVD